MRVKVSCEHVSVCGFLRNLTSEGVCVCVSLCSNHFFFNAVLRSFFSSALCALRGFFDLRPSPCPSGKASSSLQPMGRLPVSAPKTGLALAPT